MKSTSITMYGNKTILPERLCSCLSILSVCTLISFQSCAHKNRILQTIPIACGLHGVIRV